MEFIVYDSDLFNDLIGTFSPRARNSRADVRRHVRCRATELGRRVWQRQHGEGEGRGVRGHCGLLRCFGRAAAAVASAKAAKRRTHT